MPQLNHSFAALSDDHSAVQEAAVSSIVKFGPASVQPLITALLDASSKEQAARALGFLCDENRDACANAVTIIESLEPDRLAEILRDLLTIPSTRICIAAIETMDLFNPYWIQSDIGNEVVSYFIMSLKHKNQYVRQVGVDVLNRIGDRRAVPALVQTLLDSSAAIRAVALTALDEVDRNWVRSDEALVVAAQVTKDVVHSSQWMREIAVKTLERIDADLSKIPELESVPVLIRALSNFNESAGIRKNARHMLERIDANWCKSEPAKAAIPAVVSALTMPDWETVEEAAFLLGETGDPAAINSLCEALQHTSNKVRTAAAVALGKIRSSKAIGPLIHRLRDGSSDVWPAAVAALKNIDPNWRKSKEAILSIPAFEDDLMSDHWDWRNTAIQAIGEIQGREALNKILSQIEMEFNSFRQATIQPSFEKVIAGSATEKSSMQSVDKLPMSLPDSVFHEHILPSIVADRTAFSSG